MRTPKYRVDMCYGSNYAVVGPTVDVCVPDKETADLLAEALNIRDRVLGLKRRMRSVAADLDSLLDDLKV